MTQFDQHGHPLSGASPAARDHYERATGPVPPLQRRSAGRRGGCDRRQPRLRHGASAEGVAEPARHRAGRHRGRARRPRRRHAALPQRRASRGISPRSAIWSRAAGMRRAGRSCGSAPIIRTTCWRCRPVTRSTSSPATPGMLRDRIARALADWSAGHAGLSRAARHARLRPRGDGRLRPCRGRRPPRRRARAARRLGAACGRACAGDAGPHRRRHRLDARQSRRRGAATASSPSTIGGTSRSIISTAARPTRCCGCSTARSSAPARWWRWTWSMRRRCCGACICAA